MNVTHAHYFGLRILGTKLSAWVPPISSGPKPLRRQQLIPGPSEVALQAFLLWSALTSAPRLTLGQGGNQKGIEKGVWIWFKKLVSNDWSKVNAKEFPSINSQPWEVGCILLDSTSRKSNSKEGCSTGIQYHCQPSSMPPTFSDGPHCTLTTFLSPLALVYLKLLS